MSGFGGAYAPPNPDVNGVHAGVITTFIAVSAAKAVCIAVSASRNGNVCVTARSNGTESWCSARARTRRRCR